MKLDEINGNRREDLEKRIEMQSFYDKNYEENNLKLGCLNYSLGVRNRMS